MAARDARWAPATVVLTLTDASPPEGPSTLGLELRWEDKPANRLPEATWLARPAVRGGSPRHGPRQAGPGVSRPSTWWPGGGRHLHAVGEGVRWPAPDGTVALRTLTPRSSPRAAPACSTPTRDDPELTGA